MQRSLGLFMCLFSFYLSIYLLFIFCSICLSNYISISLSIYLSTYLSLTPSIFLSLAHNLPNWTWNKIRKNLFLSILKYLLSTGCPIPQCSLSQLFMMYMYLFNLYKWAASSLRPSLTFSGLSHLHHCLASPRLSGLYMLNPVLDLKLKPDNVVI